MNRNVLLLEPNYKNKYPPMGLMKLATYHRMLGDNVVFYKGNLRNFILERLYDKLLIKIKKIDSNKEWENLREDIVEYIKTGKTSILEELTRDTVFKPMLSNCFIYYKDYFRKKKYITKPGWDRVCVTTLFTFQWKKTIHTIEFARLLVKNPNELWVGGVMASVIPEEIEQATGIKPWRGLLDRPGILDQDNDITIENLPLDYSILDEIDYRYPVSNGYYSYMTRGCPRKCSFCAVPKIEPAYNHYISLAGKIAETKKNFGEKKDLLLLDNNVLASNRFPEIIEEIKACGFEKDAKFIAPNDLEISIRNLKAGLNDRAYIKKSVMIFNRLLNRVKGSEQQDLYNLLETNKLLKVGTASKEKILEMYPQVSDLYEKYHSKRKRIRLVDFNQGIDARLIDEEKMKLLSEIPINPLRIAFDTMKYKKVYVNAVKLAARYGIKRLSNYLLFNENDKPEELYRRLKINIELSEEYNIDIYSFPMKFHPVNGKTRLNRHFLGKHWNKKFIRAIQSILNATKGKIGRSKSFFYKAFGKDENEFFKLLYMPEAFIIFRYFFEDTGLTDRWWADFNSLSTSNLRIAKEIIKQNKFRDIYSLTTNREILSLLKYYTITKEEIENRNITAYKEKEKYHSETARKSQIYNKPHPIGI